MFRQSFLWVLLILTLLNASTQSSDKPILKKRSYTTKAIRGDSILIIDGLLTDKAWDNVPWESDFTQREPEEAKPPTEQTKFKITYDDKNLYIAIRCMDSEPDKIVKRLSRRDGFRGDWVEVNIDSYHDLRTAFSFTITAAGVKGDEAVSNNGNNWDSSWNPIWFVKTNIDNEGWTAEMKIPFSQLRFGKSEEQTWGLQFNRRFFRNEERSTWQVIPRDAPGWVSEFGELKGLLNLEPQKQLEIQPYTVAQLETYEEEPGNPFRDGNDAKLDFGIDGKIGVTNDLTLDFTINPDFGQVQADPAAIALDGFQIFFREQRPFFIENKSIFDYRFSTSNAGNTFGQDNLFYSRRIGRNPQGSVSTNTDEYANIAVNTTILGAAKFSGKTKNGWSVGILESVTGEEKAQIRGQHSEREEIIEPLTNYFVGRLQKDFNYRNTFVGGIFTATNRDALSPSLQFLHRAAYSGGIDFKHQWAKRAWYVGGNIVLSHIKGSKEAIKNTQESIVHLFQRTDASHVEVDANRTSLTGTGGNIQLGKAGSGRFNFEGGLTWRSPELELNDVGFQRQADDIRHYYWMGCRFFKPFSIFRSLRFNYNHWVTWDFEGNQNRWQWNLNTHAQFKNNWNAGMALIIKPKIFSNAALRGGPRFRYSDEIGFWNYLNTDNRKKLGFEFNSFVSRGNQDAFSFFDVGGGLFYQPLDAMRLSISPSFSKNNDKMQYVTEKAFGISPRYITAEIDQQTLSMSVRLNYTINPNLTIQYYAQPFISRGRYSNFNYVTNATASNFNDRFFLFASDQIILSDETSRYEIDENSNGVVDYDFENPDFAFVQFRSNLVVRWEYIPGSELFLVWSQSVNGSGNPGIIY